MSCASASFLPLTGSSPAAAISTAAGTAESAFALILICSAADDGPSEPFDVLRRRAAARRGGGGRGEGRRPDPGAPRSRRRRRRCGGGGGREGRGDRADPRDRDVVCARIDR